MLRHLGFILTFVCLASGCSRSSYEDYEDVARFHEDGRAKPVVALVPVFDCTDAQLAWSLSEEFTDHIKQRFLKKNSFFLSTPEQVNSSIQRLDENNNPFLSDFSWVKNAFQNQEFVIFAELVEHDIHTKELKNNFMDKLTPSSELSMIVRVRVFDLREEEPVIILQEMIHQTHLIPKPTDLMEQSPDKWKKLTFAISPMGLAHAGLCREVTKRIEEYIILAKSN